MDPFLVGFLLARLESVYPLIWGSTPGADPGFPTGERQPQSGCANLLFGIIFAKNCITV